MIGLAWVLMACAASVAAASDQPVSLTGSPGDPVRGRALVANRQLGLCLLCHSGPFSEVQFQGNLGPDLGSAARLGEGQIRQRIMDSRRINPASIMPAYFETSGLEQVASAFRGKTVLSAEQVEDIVAYLLTLH